MIDPVVYHVADVVSGVVLDRLPLAGEVSKVRGEVESASWDLALADERVPPNWLHLLTPKKTMVVAEWHGRLIQGWQLVGDTTGNPTMPLQGASLERMLERVFVRDIERYGIDLSQIAADVAAQVLVPRGGWQVQWAPCGVLDDYYTTFDAAVRVYDALEGFQAAGGGPVWMCDVDWAPGEEGRRVQKTLHIGPTLGTVRPEAIFTAKAGEYTRVRDCTGDNFALEVWGTTEGSGGQGITETSWRSPRLDEGWHPDEAFVSFPDMDEEQLAKRRDGRGKQMSDGVVVWEATLRIDEQPLLGDEWNIGDTVTLKAEPGPWDPTGGSVTATVEGWTLNTEQGTVAPLLMQEETGE